MENENGKKNNITSYTSIQSKRNIADFTEKT